MLRRDFMKRMAVGVGGLLVADDALELLVEPRRKLWAGHSFDAPLWRPMQWGRADKSLYRSKWTGEIYESPAFVISIVDQRSYDGGRTWEPTLGPEWKVVPRQDAA